MNTLKKEFHVMGTNALLISAFLTVVSWLAAIGSGSLINLSYAGFEVVFPFFAAIAVGEWGKTRTDTAFDLIASQSSSLFNWVWKRFAAVFLTVSGFAFCGMIVTYLVRREIPLPEMLLTYLAPAFFLASLCAMFGLCLSAEHAAVLACGIIWLITLLTRSMLRFPLAEYVYLFIRFAGDQNGIWMLNKITLLLLGAALWGIIYLLSRNRSFLLRA